MDQDVKIGHLVSQALIDALRETYPLRRARQSDTERNIFLMSGQQDVIEFLEYQFQEALAQAMEK